MAKSIAKTSRLEIRLGQDEREELEQAADLDCARSVSEWLRSLGLREARRLIRVAGAAERRA